MSILAHPIIRSYSSLPTDGLFAYYPFSGNANDESGSGLNGTVTNATLTTDRKAASNAAYQFNGSNTWITTPIDVDTYVDTELSISHWVKFDTLATDRVLINAYGTAYTAIYISKENTGKFRLFISDQITHNFNDSAITVSLDTTNWFHFVWTFSTDGANMDIELFKNGTSIYTASPAWGAEIVNTTTNVRFGALNSGVRVHSGKLDDFRFYDRVLTQEEITALYNE